MTNDIPNSASRPQDFRKKKKSGQLLELPSGQWVKARGVELATFIRSGQLPNALLGIVNEALKKGESGGDTQIIDTTDVDIDMVKDMFDMIDAITLQVVIDPVVHPIPTNEADRSDEKLYVDELEDQDKLYLFNWSQGTVKDLESFRKQSNADVAAVQEGDDAASEAESADRAEVE